MHFDTKILYDFIKDRKKFYTASIIITVLGILSLIIFKMNLGIDFQAGTAMDAMTKSPVTQAEVISVLKEKGYEEIPTVGGTDHDRISIRFKDVLENSEVTALQNAFKEKFGEATDFETNVVSPDMARELGLKAIYGIVISSFLIMLYVMFRFEWRFAIAANISILYDCFVVVAIFSSSLFSKSAAFTTYLAYPSTVSPGSSVVFGKLILPPNIGSSTTTSFNVTFPAFLTLNVYVTSCPTSEMTGVSLVLIN